MTQLWFDGLKGEQKLTLAELMASREYGTCAALSVAAGDWYRSEGRRSPPRVSVLRRA